MKKICLYETEIPQNLGAIIRTCACINLELYVVEPLGFQFTDKNYKRAKLDYFVKMKRFRSLSQILKLPGRKILLSPHSDISIHDFKFEDKDILIFGRESNGIELEWAQKMDGIISIPMNARTRSLNVANSVAYCVSLL